MQEKPHTCVPLCQVFLRSSLKSDESSSIKLCTLPARVGIQALKIAVAVKGVREESYCLPNFKKGQSSGHIQPLRRNDVKTCLLQSERGLGSSMHLSDCKALDGLDLNVCICFE